MCHILSVIRRVASTADDTLPQECMRQLTSIDIPDKPSNKWRGLHLAWVGMILLMHYTHHDREDYHSKDMSCRPIKEE